MSNPVAVKWFTSAMTSAPVLSGTAGTAIGILDACLVDGFGSVTLDSLVVSGHVATATDTSGHGFTDHVVVLIEGATPSGLNGEKRITKTGETTFTFDAAGIDDQTATGTITAKMAPAGWAKTYSGTNKAAYSRPATDATAMLLRVDDTAAQMIHAIMYESMTDVDTGSGPTPSTSYYSCGKSITADSTARNWRLFCDSRLFYLFVYPGSGYIYSSGMVFGDIKSYRSGDAYSCLIGGVTNLDNYYYHCLINLDNANMHLARSYTQVGQNVTSSRYAHPKNTYLGNSGTPFPNPVNNGIIFIPVECWESTTIARGVMPGLWSPVNAVNSNYDGFIFTKSGKKFLYQLIEYGSYNGAPLFDITGPWR